MLVKVKQLNSSKYLFVCLIEQRQIIIFSTIVNGVPEISDADIFQNIFLYTGLEQPEILNLRVNYPFKIHILH